MLKRGVLKLLDLGLDTFGSGRIARYVYRQAMQRTREIRHGGITLHFCIPNALNEIRATTFSEKEPETLAWIDEIPRNSVFWDIGANVGLYSCYAAKARSCRVFAFEPSVFNLELLARNIFNNGLGEQITVLPIPLADELGVSALNMSSTDWGGALSTFGHSYGYDGNPLRTVFSYSTIGISMSEVVTCLGIPRPDYIKIDVDGIEHLILKGGASVLKSVRSVLLEINDKFEEQAESSRSYLTAAGLRLCGKSVSEWSGAWSGKSARGVTSNQIWVR